ncbi:hypothetical protein HYT84_03785 [Candidatus Micrarchaeota archaeon]|nr:hypothetical protein [Candidatus Micrarchaeota archaeon]
MIEYRGILINSCEIKRESLTPAKTVDVDIKVDDVVAKAGDATIDFTYIVRYLPNLGYLKMSGSVYLAGKLSEIKEVQDVWKKNKVLTKSISMDVLNMINTTASVNGVFASRIVNMPPPLLPPRLEVVKLNTNKSSKK